MTVFLSTIQCHLSYHLLLAEDHVACDEQTRSPYVHGISGLERLNVSCDVSP